MLKYFIAFVVIEMSFCEQLNENSCSPAKDISRVVIAGGSITEIFYLLGIENKIVALDITSNFPEEAKNFPSIGYVRMLSAEGLLSMNPSIVCHSSGL